MNTNEDILRAIYDKSESEVKSIMEKEFPTLFKVKTLLEQAIVALSETDCEVTKLRKLETVCEEGCNILAEQKLIVIYKWKNNGWKPNWKDANEYKYYIWWNMKDNCFDDVNDYDCVADASSRLCFKSRALAEKASKILEKQFMNYYNF